MRILNKTNPPSCLIGFYINHRLHVPDLINQNGSLAFQDANTHNIRMVSAVKLSAGNAAPTGLTFSFIRA
jgi:hypothetical protein